MSNDKAAQRARALAEALARGERETTARRAVPKPLELSVQTAPAETAGSASEVAAVTAENEAAPKSIESPAEITPAAARPKGKLGMIIDLMLQPGGSTIEAMAAATGWQAHSVRGAISGQLKKARGLSVAVSKSDAGRFYRIVEAGV